MVTFWTCPCETCVRKRENEISSTETAPVLKTFQARMINTRMTIHKSRFLIVAFKRAPLTFPWDHQFNGGGPRFIAPEPPRGPWAPRRYRGDWRSGPETPSRSRQSVRRL